MTTYYCPACREMKAAGDENLLCLDCGYDLAVVGDARSASILTEYIKAAETVSDLAVMMARTESARKQQAGAAQMLADAGLKMQDERDSWMSCALKAGARIEELESDLALRDSEAASFRTRAEAREAQLAHALSRLNRAGLPQSDVQDVLNGLEASGAATVANWWDGFGDAEAIITVAAGREAEVDAAMLAIAFYPSGRGSPEVGEGVRYYSTDGTPPWEVSDGAGGAA